MSKTQPLFLFHEIATWGHNLADALEEIERCSSLPQAPLKELGIKVYLCVTKLARALNPQDLDWQAFQGTPITNPSNEAMPWDVYQGATWLKRIALELLEQWNLKHTARTGNIATITVTDSAFPYRASSDQITSLREALSNLDEGLQRVSGYEEKRLRLVTAGTDESAISGLRDLATRLLKERKPLQSRLVEHLAERDSATFEEIAEQVHGDDQTSAEAIRQLVRRTNRTMETLNTRLRFTVSASRVFKEVSPE